MANKNIDDFRQLDVYKRLYSLMKVIMIKVVPKLPPDEKYDLADQMRRACKSPLALFSEGFAKRFQPKHWRRYLSDTIGECNEMITHLSIVKDVYSQYINSDSCQLLIDQYQICCKQLTSFGKSLLIYHKGKRI